jgi:hypothetical protein
VGVTGVLTEVALGVVEYYVAAEMAILVLKRDEAVVGEAARAYPVDYLGLVVAVVLGRS